MATQKVLLYKTVCPQCGQQIFRIAYPTFKEQCFVCGCKWQPSYEEFASRPVQGTFPCAVDSKRALKEQILSCLKRKGKTLSLYNLKNIKAVMASHLTIIYVPMYFHQGAYAATWNEHKTKTVQKRQYVKSLHRYELLNDSLL